MAAAGGRSSLAVAAALTLAHLSPLYPHTESDGMISRIPYITFRLRVVCTSKGGTPTNPYR